MWTFDRIVSFVVLAVILGLFLCFARGPWYGSYGCEIGPAGRLRIVPVSRQPGRTLLEYLNDVPKPPMNLDGQF